MTVSARVSAWLLMAGALVLAGCTTTTPEERFQGSDEEAAEINTRLGVGYMQQGHNQRAREKLLRALDQNPRYAPAHRAMAELYVRIGDPEEAEDHYRRSLRLDSGNPETRNNYGVFLCDQGRLEEADEQFLRAARNRDYATPEYAWTNAGVCARMDGKDEQAEEYFRQALRLNPGFHSALIEMAELHYDRGEYPQARRFIRNFHNVVRPTARSLWLGVRVAREIGDVEQAQSFARRLRDDFPDSRETRQLEGS